jgi:hypothetical protein
MHKKNLLESNRYLRNPDLCEMLLRDAVCTSTAIEGVCKAAGFAVAARPAMKRSLTGPHSAVASVRSLRGRVSTSVRNRA